MIIEDPLLGKYRINAEGDQYTVQMWKKHKDTYRWQSLAYFTKLSAACIYILRHLDAQKDVVMNLVEYYEHMMESIEELKAKFKWE